MKNKMKKIVAFLCVLTLSVGVMAAWTPAKEVKATETSTDPTPVYLEGFKHVTLENFNISKEVTYSEEDKYVQLKDNNGTAVAGKFDKTLLSLNVDFTYDDSADRSALMIGGSGWNTGFAFSPNNSGQAVGIINYFHENSPMNDDTEKYQPGVLQAEKVNEALGITDFTFLEPFTLQVSFEYTTEGEDTYLTLVFYINGKQIEIDNRTGGTSGNFESSLKMKVTNTMTNHGNYIGYYKGQGGSLKLSSVVPRNHKLTSITWSDFVTTKAVGETVYLPEFKPVILEDFNISKEVTYSEEDKYVQLKDHNGTAVAGNFNKTLLSLNVDFTYDDSADRSALMIGGSGWNTGFAFSPNNSGQAVGIINYFHENSPMNDDTEKYQPGVLQAAKVNEALGRTDFTFLEPFTLQVSFEYTTEGEDTYLTLTFYVNGKQIEIDNRTGGTSGNFGPSLKMKVTNSMTNHGNYIGYYKGQGGSLKLSSPKITLPNKAFLKSGQVAYKLQDSDTITQLANTSFEGKVTFLSATDNDVIYYGGAGSGCGLRFSAYNEGTQLMLRLGNNISHDLGITATYGDDKVLYLDAATADVISFVGNEFRLKITTEYADYDGDKNSDDIQLGIFINGKLYDNRYLYAYDYTTATDADNTSNLLAGNYVTIYSDESDASNSKGIMICSTSDVTDVTYDLLSTTDTGVIVDGTYTLNAIQTTFGTITKVVLGATEITDISSGLTKAGDYTLYNDEARVGEAVLYQAGDVHPDSESDVRDLVAMMKVNANIEIDTWAGTMGAFESDFNQETVISELISIE